MSDIKKELNQPINEEVNALKDLIAVIVDYYCFKHGDFADGEDNEENEDSAFWKKHLDKDGNENGFTDIIPEEIDGLIYEAFKSKLKKLSN